MNLSFLRMVAIVKADFFIRFRRTSTIVTLLLLCLLAYFVVPAPSSGRALMVIADRRALLNSAAISTATAMMCSMLLTIIGFYLVSNSLRRDIQARTGFIIAATSMSNIEYLAGKFLGNIVYLSAITACFILSTMTMHLIRGEAPLQPLVYFTSFLAIVPPGIVFVSAIALLFESVRLLSGKIGDVLYFFVWSFLIGTTAMIGESKMPINFAAFFDITGISIMVSQVMEEANTTHVSIGASGFDQNLPPYIFNGLSLGGTWLAIRLASLSFALPLFAVAFVFFHRFNPDKIKAGEKKSSGNIFTMLNAKLKPLVRWLEALKFGGTQPTLARAIWLDTLLTFILYPITLIVFAVSLVLSFALPHSVLMSGGMPAMFFVLVVVLADVSTREKSGGMTSLMFTVPSIKKHFVWWKLGVALALTLLFTAVPIMRTIPLSMSSALSMSLGTLLIASAATSLGVLSGSPKTFAVCFLLFLYLVLSGASEPALDFAGWYGIATPGVQLAYISISIVLIIMAEIKHRFSLR